MGYCEIDNAILVAFLVHRRCKNDRIERINVWDVYKRCAIVNTDFMTALSRTCANPLGDLARLTFRRCKRDQNLHEGARAIAKKAVRAVILLTAQ
jgi:hypothetical protein